MKLRNTRMDRIEQQLTIDREMSIKATRDIIMFRVPNIPGTYHVRISRSTGKVIVEYCPCWHKGERIGMITICDCRDHREIARTITRIVKNHAEKASQGK